MATKVNEKRCLNCGVVIEGPWLENKRFCKVACRVEWVSRKYREKNPLRKASHQTVGTISELTVIIDLLSKGCEVFRSVTPHSPCDLAVLKDGTLRKVEVKTGHHSPSGQVIYPSLRESQKGADLLAVVIDGQVFYKSLRPMLHDEDGIENNGDVELQT